MAECYDICVLFVKHDEELAEKLADSIRRYRLPRGVKLPEGLDYRRILLEHAEEELDDEGRLRLRGSR